MTDLLNLTYTELFTKLLSIIKFKIGRNASYYVVKKDFTTKNYRIYKGAMLLPTQLTGETNDTVYFSVMYKLKPDNNIDNLDEGLLELTYENIASLLISEKIEPFYADLNSKDTEVVKTIKEIKSAKEKLIDYV